MRVAASVLLAALLLPGTARADVHTVTNTDDSGPGSLRWAIDAANLYGGPDTIVFDATLTGAAIVPKTPLPTVADARTTIDGDINGDGRPDIALRGDSLNYGAGLHVTGDHCKIIGLAINRCPEDGLLLEDADYSRIRSCHLGFDLAGTEPTYNTGSDVLLRECDRCIVGGTRARQRNVVGAGGYGIHLIDSASNTVSGNYVGLRRDGTRDPFHAGKWGVRLAGACHHNTIGGTTANARNRFGGLDIGVELYEGRQNTLVGNFIGLASTMNTGIRLIGSRYNHIGGTTVAERNVLANASAGIYIGDAAARGNEIQGNYFGTNASGNEARSIYRCILVDTESGPQVIGGDTPEAGNYFVRGGPGSFDAVRLKGGSGSIVQHNSFGVRPDGVVVGGYDWGIIASASTSITDNLFVRAHMVGIVVQGGGSYGIFRNTFRGCFCAVAIGDEARCCLGNLGNTSPGDDGGNHFRSSNVWHIDNGTARLVKAEGNTFGTTVRSEIDAKVYDRRDNPGRGRVDFCPLMGGVLPTGEAEPALAITGATAAPTGNGGAEITFSLSAPASVTATVLNLAGRPVRELCHARACTTGRNALTWDGCSTTGLAVAGGMYLVQVAARGDGGRQSSALTQVQVHR